MAKLNMQQKDYLKGIDSNKKRKKLKKAFKKVNEEKELEDFTKLLIKLLKTLKSDQNKKPWKIQMTL